MKLAISRLPGRTVPGPWSLSRWFATAGLLALAAVWADPAAAQWVWRDARKQLHSSDLPPPRDIPERDIVQRPTVRAPTTPPAAASAAPAASVVAGASAPAPGKLEAEVEARRARAEQEQRAKAEAEEKARAAAKAENCTAARRELAALDSGQRMVRMNDKGEREFLDDQARADATKRARSIVSSDCGAP